MKRTFCLVMVVALSSVSVLKAATTAKFDGGADTPSTLERFGDPGTATYEPAGGNPGGFLQLTGMVNGQNNYATFDRSDAGTYSMSNFSFDFIITATATPSADGFSFSYADTATYKTAGALGAAVLPAGEDPAGAGVLGFGFDTWSNQGTYDNPAVPQSSDYQEISVFWNGALVSRIDDLRLIATPLTLDDGVWHSVTGSVDFAGAKVNLNVDGKPIFTNLAVPGLAPFESRIMFAARTGGENELAGIDNLNVEYVPEPGSALIALMGFATLSLFRRRNE